MSVGKERRVIECSLQTTYHYRSQWCMEAQSRTFLLSKFGFTVNIYIFINPTSNVCVSASGSLVHQYEDTNKNYINFPSINIYMTKIKFY